MFNGLIKFYRRGIRLFRRNVPLVDVTCDVIGQTPSKRWHGPKTFVAIRVTKDVFKVKRANYGGEIEKLCKNYINKLILIFKNSIISLELFKIFIKIH